MHPVKASQFTLSNTHAPRGRYVQGYIRQRKYIGIGNMGAVHCKYIMEGRTPDIALATVADCNPARREWAKL